MKTIHKTLLMALLLATGAAAQAETRQDAESVQPPVGTETRAWVDYQTSGAAASPVPRPVAGEIAKANYERYLKSFTQPIPQRFERESFTGGSGGGAGGGSSAGGSGQ